MASTTSPLSATIRVIPTTNKPSSPAVSLRILNPGVVVFKKKSSNNNAISKMMMVEKVVTGVTAGVLTASFIMVPADVAEAATSASPSLQNFLFSILAGGAVLTAIFGAVIGVSNFDPVKRT